MYASQSLASYDFIKLLQFGAREENNQGGDVDFHGYCLGCWNCSICLLNMNPEHAASLLPFLSFYEFLGPVVSELDGMYSIYLLVQESR